MDDEALFHEALARPPAERAAFLDQACAGQPELRAVVEALLAGHEAPGSILDNPASPLVNATCASAEQPEAVSPRTTTGYQLSTAPGAVIDGRYTLLQKIGEGGMGEVWVAKQIEPVKRKVALKVRSEEHTSELQSLRHLVCRLLLEKKKNTITKKPRIYQAIELAAIADATAKIRVNATGRKGLHIDHRMDINEAISCNILRSRQIQR